MEKICGACAMDWSIDLYKGLRSQKPGVLVESIRRVGPRLNQWNRESQLTMDVCNIFELVPGEDRLFADAILFRIVDAFVSGDKDIRVSIVKVFLSALRHCRAKGDKDGIFSGMTTENRLELLRRVNVVLRVDCVKSRASTLMLFGCWAEFTKDVAEIRYAVFSSLASGHVLEIRASLFAAGRFSEISDDFGLVILDKILTLIASETISLSLRIAGTRSFAEIGCSFLLAVRSYKAGAELLQKISEEDVLAAMLMALTKISMKTATLISEQVALLCSFLSQTASANIQARVLSCINLIMEDSACFVPIGAFTLPCLFRILDEPSTPSALRCEIFQILLKMIAHGLPDMLLKDTDQFINLLTYVEIATRSPYLSERLLAFESFVCISTKLNRSETMSEFDLAKFSSGVAATVLDHIALLANELSAGTSSSELESGLERMLRLLVVFFEDNSKLGFFILERLYLIIENFIKLHNIPAVKTQNSEVHGVVNAGSNEHIHPPRVLMFHVHKFLVAFINTLNEAGGTSEQVVCKLKCLICFVCSSSLFDCSIHTFYALIWHSHVTQTRLSANEDLGVFPSKLLEREAVIDVCAQNVLAGDNWCAYKAGRYAACGGVWDVANFIFHQLVKRVQSDVFHQWLKLLVQLTDFEKKVEVLLHQIRTCLPSDSVKKPHGYIKQLVEACGSFSCSEKALEVISLKTQTFYFQRWFLDLRRRVLLVIVDILELLDNLGVKDVQSSLSGASTRLTSLAEEFDLVTSSFIDMDSKSLKIMSDLALSCSMMAFFAKFTTFTETSGDCLDVIVKDLVGRLRHIDSEFCMNLLSVLKDNGLHESSLYSLPKHRSSKTGCSMDGFLSDCRCGVKTMIELQHQSLSVGNEGARLKLYKDVTESVFNVVKAWMQMPTQIPKYFFRVRRTMGSLLFWSSPGVRKQREISVSQGSHLVLNLCIKLSDLPSDICSGFSKLYCILKCRKSLSTANPKEPDPQPYTSYRASETDTMIHLNKKLQNYVMKKTREFINCRGLHSDGDGVEAYVRFETKGKGRTQGFSTCVLDVSAFPVGSYRVYWQCGGIDKHGAYRSFLPLCSGPQFSVR